MTLDRYQTHKSEGVGLPMPKRDADVTGRRPSWYPFQIQVNAQDELDDGDVELPHPLPTERHRTLPEAQSIPWED